MLKSGITAATLHELNRLARNSASTSSVEKEITMEVSDEPEEAAEFLADGGSEESIAPDLPEEPWNDNWEVTDPIIEEPESNTSRNLDAAMVRRVLSEI
jgi:hypothetical protein